MSVLTRLHNPASLRCGCPPECICQRSLIGRAFRWYIPARFHTPVASDEKRREAEREGLSFRSE